MNPLITAGYAALDERDYAGALRSATARLEQHDEDADALEICARAYAKQNDAAKAGDFLARVIRVAPANEWAYRQLADLFLQFRRLDRAEALLRQGLRYCPDSIELHCRMGGLLSELNRLAAGEWHYRQALGINANAVPALTGLATNLIEQARLDEAGNLYAEANRLQPADADILAHGSRIAELRGDVATAEQRLAAAEALQPGGFGLLRARLELRRGSPQAALRAIGDNDDYVNGDALLERGRIRDRLGDYDNAWQDFVAGKAQLVAADPSLNYDREAVDTFAAELRETFDADLVARLPVAGQRTDVAQPVFIVGAPRSGTTLIEQAIASHNAVRAGGELPFAGDWRELSEQLIGQGRFPGNLGWSTGGDRRHIPAMLRDYYLEQAAARGLAQGKRQWFTDKMPWNEIYLPLIGMAFPGSPVIYVQRHPLDVLVSILANKLNHGFHCGYRPADIAHHLKLMGELYEHYLQHTRLSVLAVRYEDVVADEPGQLARMIAHLGLEPVPGSGRTPRYAATPSYQDVAQPVSDRAMGRHRHYETQLQPFRDLLQSRIDAAGYRPPAAPEP